MSTANAHRTPMVKFLPLVDYANFGPTKMFYIELSSNDAAYAVRYPAYPTHGDSWEEFYDTHDPAWPYYTSEPLSPSTPPPTGQYYLDGHVANLGGGGTADHYTQRRRDWWDHLQRATAALQRAKNLGLTADEWGYDYVGAAAHMPSWTNFHQAAGGCFTGLPRIDNYKWGSNATPDCFILDPDVVGDGGARWAYYTVLKIVILHNILYGTELVARNWDLSILLVDQGAFDSLLDNVEAALEVLAAVIIYEVEQAELAAAQSEAGEGMEGAPDFDYEPLRTHEMLILKTEPKYLSYFSTTFSSQIITNVPLIHNFYLTSKYFRKTRGAFVSTKNRASDILISTMRDDDNFVAVPNLSRPASEAAIADSAGTNPNAAIREYILKALAETPLNILKGLAELIDPHLNLAKIIKGATGDAFNAMSVAMDPGAVVLNELRAEMMQGLASDAGAPIGDDSWLPEGEELNADGSPANVSIDMSPQEYFQTEGATVITGEELEEFREITGEDLLAFLLCLVDASFRTGEAALAENLPPGPPPPWAPGPPPGNFFPRIDMSGVDFAGTVAGMLMMPPTPLGLVYLLLELIKNNETNTTENVADAPVSTEC